jgi:hypothetical protein
VVKLLNFGIICCDKIFSTATKHVLRDKEFEIFNAQVAFKTRRDLLGQRTGDETMGIVIVIEQKMKSAQERR